PHLYCRVKNYMLPTGTSSPLTMQEQRASDDQIKKEVPILISCPRRAIFIISSLPGTIRREQNPYGSSGPPGEEEHLR
ncbi:hypothetical protein, partial [Methanoculleus sp.]|uniref:hypothetical protein n=1 Tax=Methanoculleus sp. TaxID=90427 RepID=UPI00261A5644